jgi:hypothetical protein
MKRPSKVLLDYLPLNLLLQLATKSAKERKVNKYPNKLSLAAVQVSTDEGVAVNIVDFKGEQNWVPARPTGYASIRNRFKCAWLVFTGKADALIWPGGQ